MARARTVLVTGGGRRIGAAIVRGLAGCGHRVVVHHHHSEHEAAALAHEIDPVGERIFLVAADLAEAGMAADLIAAARRVAGTPVDGLVNCASRFEFDRPPAFDAELLARLSRVNLSAPVALACALAEQPDVSDAAVVDILDQKLDNLNPDFFSYTCSKSALASATVMLAQALGPRVRVNALSPGLTLPSDDQTAAEFDAVACENLLRRPIALGSIAEAVAFLLDARGVTGQTLHVDNGQRLLPRDGDVMFSARGPR